MINGISFTFALALKQRRERNRSLLLFPAAMNNDIQAKTVEQILNNLLEKEPGFFLVELGIRPTNNIRVYVDADSGASIDRLVYLNRTLYKQLEETLFPNGDFSLEVSSPGLDEPLKLHRQYMKNIGRPVEVLLQSGVKKEGKLLSATETDIVLEEEKGKGKKKEFVQHVILKTNIKTTKIKIKW